MLLAALLLLAPALPLAQADADADRAELLEGVGIIERHGVPGTVCVYGSEAFCVLTANERPLPVAAAARFGKGRAVAIAHSSYLEGRRLADGASGAAVFFANALRWMGGEGSLRIALVGRDEQLEDALRGLGHAVVDAVAGSDVVVVRKGLAAADAPTLRAFVEAGGGLIVAVCPWGYEQANRRRGLTLRADLPENRVLAPMGMVFAPGQADATSSRGFSVAASRPADAHAGRVLGAILAGDETGERVYVVEHAIRSVPSGVDSFRSEVARVLERFEAGSVPRPERPLRSNEPVGRVGVVWWTHAWSEARPGEVRAAPGSDAFPGAVPADAPRVERALELDPRVPGWHSSGLYLAPGEELELTFGEARGWQVRVGCHRDRLWRKDSWKRWPEISRSVALEVESSPLHVATPFGGLVYFVAGEAAERPLAVRVSGVVEAPFYDLADPARGERWREGRRAPAPWAELLGRHVILSLPSDAVRDLDDPAACLEWWDSVLLSHYELAGVAPPKRRERLVADVQISAGYMHAGYPIMTHLDKVEHGEDGAPPPLLDVARLRKEGDWGYFHELGHNLQKKDWTFAGTGEVTCNLFSLYTMHALCGIEPWEHPWLARQKKKGAEYLARDAPFDEWKRKPGVALLCYAQLQREFGWAPFELVMRQYEGLTEAARPRDDQSKIDAWTTRMSFAVKRDLRGFFRRWGLPLSDEVVADEELGRLEEWMPDWSDL